MDQQLARPWVTIQEAAEYLGITTATVRRRIASGDLKARRLKGGPSIRLRASDVEALLEPVRRTAAPRRSPR